jgi:hypothetical protein
MKDDACNSAGFATRGLRSPSKRPTASTRWAGFLAGKLHPLKGDLRGFWSLTVTGNWRLIFSYEETTNTADDLDLIDYH